MESSPFDPRASPTVQRQFSTSRFLLNPSLLLLRMHCLIQTSEMYGESYQFMRKGGMEERVPDEEDVTLAQAGCSNATPSETMSQMRIWRCSCVLPFSISGYQVRKKIENIFSDVVGFFHLQNLLPASLTGLMASVATKMTAMTFELLTHDLDLPIDHILSPRAPHVIYD